MNLDGKVNPAALRAKLDGRHMEYVVESGVEYLADWEGILTWLESPMIRENFEAVVHDERQNLAVLRRVRK